MLTAILLAWVVPSLITWLLLAHLARRGNDPLEDWRPSEHVLVALASAAYPVALLMVAWVYLPEILLKERKWKNG